MANLRVHNLLIGRFWHSLLPGRITDFETVSARVVKVKLTPGEMALGPVFEFDNRNVSLVKCLASLRETFGAYGEGMMHSVFDDGLILGLFPLAQKYIVIPTLKQDITLLVRRPIGLSPSSPP